MSLEFDGETFLVCLAWKKAVLSILLYHYRQGCISTFPHFHISYISTFQTISSRESLLLTFEFYKATLNLILSEFKNAVQVQVPHNKNT